MTRLVSPGRHGDPVEVRRGQVDSDDAPEQFLWRGRLYVVRAVLARWTESGGWWRGVRALTTDATTAAAGSVELDDRERDWWRVEADSGRLAAMSAGRGVYDLCFDWSRGAWSLARVVD
ncbi:MAG: hypothetical protein QOI82_838 [Actinomycetota bacterium]|jgi:hypothetical protein|nr:hypothetical protein [Actinomycetota bacterium]